MSESKPILVMCPERGEPISLGWKIDEKSTLKLTNTTVNNCPYCGGVHRFALIEKLPGQPLRWEAASGEGK